MNFLQKMEGFQALPYEKKLRIRQNYMLVLVCVGVVLVLLSLRIDLEIYTSMGGCLAGIGIIRYLRLEKLRRDTAKMAELELREQDERNRFLGRMCWAYSGYLLYLALFLGIVISAPINRVVSLTLCAVMLVYLLFMVILSFQLNKRY